MNRHIPPVEPEDLPVDGVNEVVRCNGLLQADRADLPTGGNCVHAAAVGKVRIDHDDVRPAGMLVRLQREMLQPAVRAVENGRHGTARGDEQGVACCRKISLGGDPTLGSGRRVGLIHFDRAR